MTISFLNIRNVCVLLEFCYSSVAKLKHFMSSNYGLFRQECYLNIWCMTKDWICTNPWYTTEWTKKWRNSMNTKLKHSTTWYADKNPLFRQVFVFVFVQVKFLRSTPIMDKIIKPNLTGTYLKRYVFTVMIKYT